MDDVTKMAERSLCEYILEHEGEDFSKYLSEYSELNDEEIQNLFTNDDKMNGFISQFPEICKSHIYPCAVIVYNNLK